MAQSQMTIYFYRKDKARLDLLTERLNAIAKKNGDPPVYPVLVVRKALELAATQMGITQDEITGKMAATPSQS